MLGSDVIVVSECRSLDLRSDAVLVCPALLQAIISLWGELSFVEMHIDADTVPDSMAARILRRFGGERDIYIFSSRWERAHAHDGSVQRPCCAFVIEIDGASESLAWEDASGVVVHRAIALRAHEAAAPRYGCKGVMPPAATGMQPVASFVRRPWLFAREHIAETAEVKTKASRPSLAGERDAARSGIAGNPRRSRVMHRVAEEPPRPVKRTVGPRHQQRPSVRGRKADTSSMVGQQRKRPSRLSIGASQRKEESRR